MTMIQYVNKSLFIDFEGLKNYYLVDNKGCIFEYVTFMHDPINFHLMIIFMNKNNLNKIKFKLEMHENYDEKWNYELISKWRYRLINI